jgi:hypothetical protein
MRNLDYNHDNNNLTNTAADLTYSGVEPNRSYLLIQNTSATGNLFVGFGVPATQGIVIPPLGAYEPLIPPTNAINLRPDTAGVTFTVIRG